MRAVKCSCGDMFRPVRNVRVIVLSLPIFVFATFHCCSKNVGAYLSGDGCAKTNQQVVPDVMSVDVCLLGKRDHTPPFS